MADVGVRVFVRFRPRNSIEKKKRTKKSPNVTLEIQGNVISYRKFEKESVNFEFDDVLGEEWTQESTFVRIAEPVCKDILDGYNGTIFVYGQTGSGKTYTQFGEEYLYKAGNTNVDMRTLGLIPRCVPYLLSKIRENIELDQGKSMIEAQALEIYFEKFRDLLNPEGPNLKVVGNEIPYLTKTPITSLTDAFKMIRTAMKNRVTMSTKMNSTSSRSHAIVILHVTQTYHNGTKKIGKVNFADLAGSEKVSKTGAVGLKLNQATAINLSLTNLGIVINALAAEKPFIPHRNSSLTWFLKDSLSGNFKTTLIVSGSLAPFNIQETVNSLRFGQRCKLIKTRAKVNKVLTRACLQKKIKQLSQRVAELEKENEELSVKVVEEKIAAVTLRQEKEEQIDAATLRQEEEKTEISKCVPRQTIERPHRASQINKYMVDLEKVNKTLKKNNVSYKSKIDDLEENISKLRTGLKDLYIDFGSMKKEFDKNKKDLNTFTDRNRRLESQLEETLEANGNLQEKADLFKQELAEEKIKTQKKKKVIEVMKMTENNIISPEDKSCPMCLALSDEKSEIEAARDRLQALVDIYKAVEDEHQRTSELDDEALEELLKKQEEYMNSFLTYRSHQENADWNLAQKMAKEEADKIEMERLKLQEIDADFAMQLSNKYQQEHLDLTLKRKEDQLKEQILINPVDDRSALIAQNRDRNAFVAQYSADEELARRIAADENRLISRESVGSKQWPLPNASVIDPRRVIDPRNVIDPRQVIDPRNVIDHRYVDPRNVIDPRYVGPRNVEGQNMRSELAVEARREQAEIEKLNGKSTRKRFLGMFGKKK